jgi:hypothetical protein
MTLVKSKINSLGWLKSAIYISVVGGVILSSTRVLAASISRLLTDTEEELSFTVIQPEFKGGISPLRSYDGRFWKVDFLINETNGPRGGHDTLSILVLIQHLIGRHPGENGKGKELRLDFRLNSINQNGLPNPKIVPDSDFEFHSGTRGHVDNARGTVKAFLSNPSIFGIPTGGSDIDGWNLEVKASHGVPEPLTMLGAATALGYGALLKRKYSENKKS